MTRRTKEEIKGLEYDWIATDHDGHVALFSTAGAGWAPDEFLADTDAHEAVIDTILAAPARCRALSAPEVKDGLVNTWRLVAERGLFAFDSNPNGGPYRRVSVPETPLRCADLPAVAAAVAGRVLLHRVCFAEVRRLSAGEMIQGKR